ncbi:MAG: tetratricopeptide repeat protein [bacterium]
MIVFSGFVRVATGSDEYALAEGVTVLSDAYDQWDRTGFYSSIVLFDRVLSNDSDNARALYWKGTALFFISLHYLYSRERKADQTEGIKTVKQGILMLSKAIHNDPLFSESYALRGVLRGMRIQLNPWTAVAQGPRVFKDRAKALQLNEQNPRVHFLTGVSFWYAPQILGSKKDALEHFLKAAKLFGSVTPITADPTSPRWGHSMCLAFIGDYYSEQHDTIQARDYYEQSLAVNPKDPLAIKGLNKLNQQQER